MKFGGDWWFLFFSRQAMQKERKRSLTYPLLFAISICSRFRLPRQQKRAQLELFQQEQDNKPRNRTSFCPVGAFCKVPGGGAREKKEKLTERNPSKIPYLLYYDVGISCSEKQLPDMDQSIRYISYFSRRKRKEEGGKKLLALFYCIHIIRYVEIKNSTAGRGWGEERRV